MTTTVTGYDVTSKNKSLDDPVIMGISNFDDDESFGCDWQPYDDGCFQHSDDDSDSDCYSDYRDDNDNDDHNVWFAASINSNYHKKKLPTSPSVSGAKSHLPVTNTLPPPPPPPREQKRGEEKLEGGSSGTTTTTTVDGRVMKVRFNDHLDIKRYERLDQEFYGVLFYSCHELQKMMDAQKHKQSPDDDDENKGILVPKTASS